ncbi:MAG: tetratricopeptide repeat protein [Steroidobacteraceae bacterium]
MVGAHCTEGGRFQPVIWLAATLLLGLLAAAPAFAAQVPPPSAQWTLLESRIERDYFQQDAAGLVALGATLSSGDGPVQGNAQAEWGSYYEALLAYRLALLTKDNEVQAWPFTQRCVERLNEALGLDPGSAEALALQSACLALQSHLDPWRSPLAAPLSLDRINKALKLAPQNPRVLLLGAVGADERPKLFGGDSQEAFTLLERSVSAFEAQGARGRGLPGWGAADAFTSLARDYLTRGNALAARNVLERALLVAPNFAQARQLMAEIVSG